MKYLNAIIVSSILFSCAQPAKVEVPTINDLAEQYVRIGLFIGEYDADFVDAYYGPDSLKPAVKPAGAFPKDSLLAVVQTLKNSLKIIESDSANALRAKWMQQQLTAFDRRIRVFSGEHVSFDEESRDLFGTVAPAYPESHYQDLLLALDSILPGNGAVGERYQVFAKKFVIPKDKVDTVFRAAIAEARKRTYAHYQLPENENFTLEYVTGKSWSGYNWYKGNYQSLIQISNDLDIFIERAIDLACHEGYPGHHVYNMMLEKNMYREKGWVEISLYPLFSPQSLIAEGSANYGIEVTFPGDEDVQFTRDVLLPLAGLDTTGVSFYFKALALRSKLNFARNEVARGLLNGSMSEDEALRWLRTYNLFSPEASTKSINFIRKYRSYVINYNHGLQLIKDHISKKGGNVSTEKSWEAFRELLSSPVLSTELSR